MLIDEETHINDNLIESYIEAGYSLNDIVRERKESHSSLVNSTFSDVSTHENFIKALHKSRRTIEYIEKHYEQRLKLSLQPHKNMLQRIKTLFGVIH